MKPPYFSLNIRLLFLIYFGSGFESGSEIRIRNRIRNVISVPDRIRIRPKISDPYGSGSGSGSATLKILVAFVVKSPRIQHGRAGRC